MPADHQGREASRPRASVNRSARVSQPLRSPPHHRALRTAHLRPARCLGTRGNFDTARSRQATSTAERAASVWKKLLDEYEQPPLDPGTDEALRDFVARRKRELRTG